MRLGRAQRAILAALAEHPDGLCVADLTGQPGHSAAASACRQSLARLKREGLVTRDTEFATLPGKSVVWQATAAGRQAHAWPAGQQVPRTALKPPTGACSARTGEHPGLPR